MRIERLQLRAKRSSNDARIRFRLYVQREAGEQLVLCRWQIEVTPDLRAQSHVLSIFHDAHDRGVRNFFKTDLLTERIRVAEEVLRHLLADDGDLRTTDAIRVVEVASGDEGNRERLEVI